VGTFHADAHPLHGITCVVEWGPSRVAVGRVHGVEGLSLVLHDADLWEDGPSSPPRADFLSRAAAVGVWPRHRRLDVPASEVLSVRRLGGA
jgi:hypothetical protein